MIDQEDNEMKLHIDESVVFLCVLKEISELRDLSNKEEDMQCKLSFFLIKEASKGKLDLQRKNKKYQKHLLENAMMYVPKNHGMKEEP